VADAPRASTATLDQSTRGATLSRMRGTLLPSTIRT
jgi:hypothetical protein